MDINKLREKIDKIDSSIIKKLSQRSILSVKIGKMKSKMGRKVKDNKREEKLMQYYEKLCAQHHLHPLFVKKLFKLIIANSRDLQNGRKYEHTTR